MNSLLDLRHSVETPEQIEITVQLAGPYPRLRAWIIDAFLRYVALMILGIILGTLGETGSGVFLILLFLINWFYPVYFEVMHQGQSPGKKTAGLRVVREDLRPLTLGTSTLRNLLRTFDMLPVGYLLGLVCMATGQRFQRWGDIVAGTLVIHVPKPLPKPKINVEPIPPPQSLQANEHDALIQFAVRGPKIHPKRQAELAGFLKDLLPQKSDPIEETLGWTAWLLGARSSVGTQDLKPKTGGESPLSNPIPVHQKWEL
jgi:uncharacterized RDD family membrane protein YckC